MLTAGAALRVRNGRKEAAGPAWLELLGVTSRGFIRKRHIGVLIPNRD